MGKIQRIQKRDGEIVRFDKSRITNAIFAASKAVGAENRKQCEKLAKVVTERLEKQYEGKQKLPDVETIQNLVENILMEKANPETAKAYIRYRQQHEHIREIGMFIEDVTAVEDYINKDDWEVKENANMSYSLQGLNNYLSEKMIKKYWLKKMYPKNIQAAHEEGLFHIHDLGVLGPYSYYGKESIIAKVDGEIKLTSFQSLYEQTKKKERILSREDDAREKTLENVQVLDKDGWTNAQRVVKKARKKNMHFIKNEGGRSVIVTEDHPMITAEGKVKEAQHVKERDKLLTSNVGNLLSNEELFEKDEIFIAEELQKKEIEDFWIEGMPLKEYKEFSKDLKVNGIVSTSNNANSLPNKLELTEDLGYLIGFCLAEGSIGPHRVSIKQKKDSEIVKRLKKCARALGCRIYSREEKDILELRIVNSTFTRYLLEEIFNCGRSSREKKLPEDILTYNKQFVKGILAGLLDGDGSISTSRTSLTIRIVSRMMLEQSAILLNLLGYTARDRALEGIGTKRFFRGKEIVQKYPLFGVGFRTQENNLPSIKYRSAEKSTKAWRAEEPGWHKVLNSEKTEVKDSYVYDITTESGTLLVNGMWNHNCVGWDLKDFLSSGFEGVRGKIETTAPKHFAAALGQLVNLLYTLQGEAAGAQAVSNVDTLLAPFIAYDNLSRREVEQEMQSWLFNMNVPTRVGFQCLSEDTEILTPEGWRSYDEVEEKDTIKTFNLEKKILENKKVKKVFRKKYKGKMYNAKNRIQDQLISPGHRMVRRKFNTNNMCLEEVEEVKKLKSPPIIPIAADNENQEIDLKDEQIKLMAWVVSEGSMETKGNRRRITIYQSKKKNREKYEEIKSILNHLNITYTTQEGSESLGESVTQIRLNAESSRKVLKMFDKEDNVKHIPKKALEMSQRQSAVFLETYLKGDGHEGCKITVSDEDILEALQQVIVNAGYAFTVWKRRATGVGNKMLYILRIIRHQETYLQKIEEVDYEGVIWSVNTDNETVVARRKGKVFITGNTPFTNITLDLKVPEHMKNEPVLIGGELKDRTYGEFQEQLDLFNEIFAKLMMDGDAKGRPFTFPIPTYNISKDFDWDNEKLDPIWEMTAKYGIPYFANFVNSDLNPEDARSMCCRLRLDKRELKKRGGGLFGADPQTGSIGVVTINMPRIGYEAKDEDQFMEILNERMDMARKSLEIKREVLEGLTEKGLFPYSKYYLRKIKEVFGKYWKNHFSTIGINGMNDAVLNFIDTDIGTEEGIKFTEKVLIHMRDRLADYQEETGDIFNLEATPAEGTSYRLARMDQKKYPDLRIYNQEVYGSQTPYYTNSTQLPVRYTNDLFQALEKQDPLQTKYTGGTVFHGFLGEKMPSEEATKRLVKKIAENYSLPYYTLTPTFSICPKHGYMPGEHRYCPTCDKELIKKMNKKGEQE